MKHSLQNLAAALLTLASSATGQSAFAPKSAYVVQADQLAKTRAEAVEKLTACDRDLIVIDAAFGNDGDWTPEGIATIRAGKSGRRVVASMTKTQELIIGSLVLHSSFPMCAFDSRTRETQR